MIVAKFIFAIGLLAIAAAIGIGLGKLEETLLRKDAKANKLHKQP